MIKNILIAIMAVFVMNGCDTSMDEESTVVNNYEATEGGVVLILNNDGSKECYNTGADSNGSECNQDTYIEFTFDGEEEAAQAEAEAEIVESDAL